MSASPNPIQDNSTLIKALAMRDRKVFEMIYKEHYEQLFSIASRYVGRMETAEEIVHDVFITIWNKADKLKIKHSVKAYLIKAVINTSLNYIKKEKLHTTKRLNYMTERQGSEVDETSEDAEEALLISLEQALQLLPEKCKHVMYLSRFGKMKQNEIAAQMNISIKTVKNHITYGFQKLREHLEKHKGAIVLLFMLMKSKL